MGDETSACSATSSPLLLLPPDSTYLERHNVVGLLVPGLVDDAVRAFPQVPAPILLNLLVSVGVGGWMKRVSALRLPFLLL